MSYHASEGPDTQRLADLLDGGPVTPRDLDLYDLVLVADALRRRAPVRPSPAFRRRLRQHLVGEVGRSGGGR